MEEKYVAQLQKTIKKCVIQDPDKTYPYKNVTVWPELEIYEQVKPGYQVPENFTIEVKQGKAINPRNGKPYNQYTLTERKNPNGTIAKSFEERLLRLEDEVFHSKAVLKSEMPSTDYLEEEDNRIEIPF